MIDANTAFITTSTNIAVLTGGIAVFPGGSAAVLTSGTVYGTTGSLGVRPFILGEPNLWIRAVGPNGELGAIPFYTRTGAI